jgi:hypothetical protein
VKRAIVLALSVILALTMAAPTVLARSVNGTAPTDASQTFTVEAGAVPGSCDFPLLLEVSGKAKTIVLPDGAVVGVTSIGTSPGLDVTVTNFTNEVRGKSLTFNITGAFHNSADTPQPGQVTTVSTGRSLFYDPVAGTVIAIGNFTIVYNSDFTVATPLEGKGQLIDVCALLE